MDELALDDEMERRLAELLRPMPGDSPCGEPLRYTPEYDQLRELRRQDDPTLPTGVWESPLKKADWAGVEDLAGRLLRERGKDLMVAAWLGEAWLHLRGLSGLRAALALLSRCCETYWDDVHPLPRDGDMSFRTGPLEWAARGYAAIVETEMPVMEGAPPRDVKVPTLAGWREMNRVRLAADDDGEAQRAYRLLEGWVSALPGRAVADGREALDDSRRLLQRLDAWCDERMARDAPSFLSLRQTLDQFDLTLRELAAMQPSFSAQPAPDPACAEAPNPAAPPPLAAAPGEPVSREDAYRQLRLIAAYLARTEPHSPVPYLIHRAVEWGDKPLRALLAELLDSDAEARRLWSLLGVLP
ncbi:type VI secretion system protein TssA [Chromobacterium vaccinii]|uniref:Type VI secretion system protein TssA n=1 Tax=Chromobacterium vaccinii TaxID=1108595 RepID=A0ABV0FHY5_9NEIS